ncbi:MAG: hypothetical protein JWM10_2755 [Myxococcaceae bacterium]|nr:hypothetical protein [Myxococcaceae bacterium]
MTSARAVVPMWLTWVCAAALSAGCSPPGDRGDTATGDDFASRDAVASTPADAGDARSADATANPACGATLGGCDPVANRGCPPGRACYVVADVRAAGSACADAGSHGWGDLCESAEECRPGFACVGIPRTCQKLCCGSADESCRDEPNGGRARALCVGNIVGTQVHTCMDVVACSVFAVTGNGCPADHPRCGFITAGGTTSCFPVSPEAAAHPEGAACSHNVECQPGFVCVPADLEAPARPCAARADCACRRTCHRVSGARPPCPPGRACGVSFDGTPADYGACVPTG